MDRKVTPPIPERIAQLQRQLEQFRGTQPPRTKLPDALWQAAVELARQHSVYPVAHPLKLDYMGLKKRLDGVPRRIAKASQSDGSIRRTVRATASKTGGGSASSGKGPGCRIGQACCVPGGCLMNVRRGTWFMVSSCF